MKIVLYEDMIRKRASLRECVEFAFDDEDICKGENDKKLIGFYGHGELTKRSKDESYRLLMSDDGTWKKDPEYRYMVLVYSWDENDPETIFEDWSEVFVELYGEHVFLFSIHENEDSIYVHLIVRKEEDKAWPDEEESLEGITASQADYLDAMRYLLY